jgi:hypothetical protein
MIDLVGMVKKEVIKRKMKRWHNEHDGKRHGDHRQGVAGVVLQHGRG